MHEKLKCVAYGVAGVDAFTASGWFFVDMLLDKSMISGVICWVLWVMSCFLMRQSELVEDQDGKDVITKRCPRKSGNSTEDEGDLC